MTLVIKVGNDGQFPASPRNWPKCGSFSQENERKLIENKSLKINSNFEILLLIVLVEFVFLFK